MVRRRVDRSVRERLISSLVDDLAVFPASSVAYNPYAAEGARRNLWAYLKALCDHRYSGYLLIGEAPGYRGCAITGIPFTSERVLRSGSHQFLRALLPSLTLTGNRTEPTATIVWRQFAGKKTLPAFWNIYPFHPHPPDVRNGNRRPNLDEIKAGICFLDRAIAILAPHTLVAVGQVAERSLLFMKADHQRLPRLAFRHPSHGGAARFRASCAALNIP